MYRFNAEDPGQSLYTPTTVGVISYVLLAPGCPRATRKRKAGSITSGLRRDRGVQLGRATPFNQAVSSEASETAIGLVVLPTQTRPQINERQAALRRIRDRAHRAAMSVELRSWRSTIATT